MMNNDDSAHNGAHKKEYCGLVEEPITDLKKLVLNKSQCQKHNVGDVRIDENSSGNDEVQQNIEQICHTDVIREYSLNSKSIMNYVVEESRPTDDVYQLPPPSYERAFQQTLNNETSDEEQDDDAVQYYKKNLWRTCFNCGKSNHIISKCPERRNYKRITRAMNEYKSRRYYTVEEATSSPVVPTKIRGKGKDAMGLGEGESLDHLCGMQGYSPLSLNGAKIGKSNLTIYDSNGNRILASDKEGGEIHEHSFKCNLKNMIDFPEINQHRRNTYHYDYKLNNVPSFSGNQPKEEVIKSLNNAALNACNHWKLRCFPTSSPADKSNTNLKIVNNDESLKNNVPIEPSKKSVNTKNVESINYIKESFFGTPIRKYNKYDSLPSRANFKHGVTDITDLYNAPTSSGNFKEMKKVLQMAEKTLQKIE